MELDTKVDENATMKINTYYHSTQQNQQKSF
jgi:hypothetical protein